MEQTKVFDQIRNRRRTWAYTGRSVHFGHRRFHVLGDRTAAHTLDSHQAGFSVRCTERSTARCPEGISRSRQASPRPLHRKLDHRGTIRNVPRLTGR